MNISRWRKRIEKLEGNGHELVLETIEKCEKEHGNCCENVCDTISAWYAKYAKDGKVTYVEAVRLNRMLELLDCIDDELRVVTEEEDNLIAILVASLLGLYSTRLNVDFELDTFRTQWVSEGIWYSDTLINNRTLLLAYLASDLKQRLARGDTLPEILAAVRKRFKTSGSSLTALIQTLATDYESDILRHWITMTGYTKYVWITIQDGRQCDDCDAMDGLIFDVRDYERGVTAPSLHRRCRCQIAPAD